MNPSQGLVYQGAQPGSGGHNPPSEVPAKPRFWSTTPSEVEPRGLRTAPPNQGAEESQPTFGLPSPTSEVEPRGLRTAPPNQGAEESQPSFGLPNSPTEVEPSGLRTAPPNQGAEESQPNFGLPNPPSEVEHRGLRMAPPNQGAEESQPRFGLPTPEVEPRGLRTNPPTREREQREEPGSGGIPAAKVWSEESQPSFGQLTHRGRTKRFTDGTPQPHNPSQLRGRTPWFTERMNPSQGLV